MSHSYHERKTSHGGRYIWVSVFLTVVSLVALGVSVYYNGRLFLGENGTVMEQDKLPQTEFLAGNQDDIESGNLQKPVSVLICGLDESEQLTDVIMLASYNTVEQTVKVLQIPRDTFVRNGTGSSNKINSAYTWGKQELTPINRLIDTINQQFAVRIDHYITITLPSFRKAVDVVGGIPVHLPEEIGDKEWGVLPKGYQILDGEKSEWLVRHRHTYYDQDIGRIKVQRIFLAAALQKAQDMGIGEINRLIPVLYREVTTDMTLGEIFYFARRGMEVPMEQIEMALLPGEGTTYEGHSVWSIHKEETAELLNRWFRLEGTVSADNLKIEELSHTVTSYDNSKEDFGSILTEAS